MKGLLIKKSKVGFLFSFLLISQILNCDKLSAQELKKSKDYKEIEIKGTVLISTGNLVPFASITIKGKSVITVTDKDGKFTIMKICLGNIAGKKITELNN